MGILERLSVDEVSAEIGVPLDDVRRAAERLSGVAHRTPVLTSRLLNDVLSDGETAFFFKVEAMQRTGSFKFRGAYNAMAALSEREKDGTGPVVSHSSGNHGMAVANAAALHGRKAYVVVPRGAPAVKLAAIESYGAQIVRCGPTIAERAASADEVCNRVGGTLIHPYMNRDVVAGQGTIALELLEQVADLDALVVPIGGGGMISGISIVAKALNPSIRLIGAEPLAADDAARSLASRTHVYVAKSPATIADGLKASLGELGWCVVSNLIESIVTVREEEIASATRLVWERMKVVIEPSAGVGVAAVRTQPFRALGLKRVGVVLCGGNVDLGALPWLPTAGLDGNGGA
jgi:threonine dehydratase